MQSFNVSGEQGSPSSSHQQSTAISVTPAHGAKAGYTNWQVAKLSLSIMTSPSGYGRRRTLRESEERYRRILDLSQEGIWVLDEQFRTTFVNSQISKWLGYPSEDIVGHPMEEFLFQEDIPDHQREMQQRKMKIDSQYEQRFQRKDGGVVWAIVSAKAISRDDKFQGSFAMLTDITERKKTEEALQESEGKYRLLIENQTDLVTKMDPEYRFLFVSPSYCKMFGKTEEELFGKTFLLPLVHEDDLEVTANALRGIVRPPYTSNYEQRAMTKDGWRWFAWSGTAVLDDNKNVTAIISVGRDITERKEAEEALQKSEEMYRVLVENAGEALVVAQDGMLRFTNPKAEEVTGFSQAELMSLPFLELIHPEDRSLVASTISTGYAVNRRRTPTSFGLCARMAPTNGWRSMGC